MIQIKKPARGVKGWRVCSDMFGVFLPNFGCVSTNTIAAYIAVYAGAWVVAAVSFRAALSRMMLSFSRL